MYVAVELRELGDDRSNGLFVSEPVSAGTVIVVFGGERVDARRLAELSDFRQRHSLQIDHDTYLTTSTSDDSLDIGDYVNHSCDPNAWLVDEITLAARRDLRPGDELTYDYATSDSTPYDEFDCACGSPACRGRVTGADWTDPTLQRRYDGHFSPYLQRRINRDRR